jgi:hypothetical protein
MNGFTRKQLDRLIGLEVAKLGDHAAADLLHWLSGRPIQFHSRENEFVEAPPEGDSERLPILRSVA